MTIEEFHSLQFGDIIADEQGNEFMVTHSLENDQGQTAYVAIIPALGDPVPTNYTIIRHALPNQDPTTKVESLGPLPFEPKL
jgi:hypothetical protein